MSPDVLPTPPPIGVVDQHDTHDLTATSTPADKPASTPTDKPATTAPDLNAKHDASPESTKKPNVLSKLTGNLFTLSGSKDNVADFNAMSKDDDWIAYLPASVHEGLSSASNMGGKGSHSSTTGDKAQNNATPPATSLTPDTGPVTSATALTPDAAPGNSKASSGTTPAKP